METKPTNKHADQSWKMIKVSEIAKWRRYPTVMTTVTFSDWLWLDDTNSMPIQMPSSYHIVPSHLFRSTIQWKNWLINMISGSLDSKFEAFSEPQHGLHFGARLLLKAPSPIAAEPALTWATSKPKLAQRVRHTITCYSRAGGLF